MLTLAKGQVLLLWHLIQQPLVPHSMLETKAINDAIWTRGPNQQKSWRFPKFHLLSHAFDGISEKGVTSNYNTKPNEHEHGKTRITFESGNWKDVGEQAISSY